MHTTKKYRKLNGMLIMGTYEVFYDKFKKSWQIWHPEIGFMAAYRYKDDALDYCRNLITN